MQPFKDISYDLSWTSSYPLTLDRPSWERSILLI